MSLSTALNTAQNSLLNTQRQTGVVSRNIANWQNPDYARRSAELSSLAPGSRVAEIRRATDAALFKQNITALSGWTAQSTLMTGLDQLNMTINGIDNVSSAANMLGKLQEAIQLYSATPSNRTLAENAVEMGRQMVRTLNDSTQTIQNFRADMDSQVAIAVADLNSLLADFEGVNNEIIRATSSGREALDAYDRRDGLLKRIAELVPISTIGRANNDIMIVTADGTTLFESVPRHVSFEAQPAYGPNTVGNRVLVDGVPITPAVGANTTAGGKIAAMVQLRDTYAAGMQAQLDEVARGLIMAFSEKNPTDASDVRTGLFTWPGGPDTPPAGLLVPGLAGMISLNSLADPQKPGGNAERLRDGINPDFDFNPNNNASYSGLLIGFIGAMDAPQNLVAAGGNIQSTSLMTYSTGVVSWLEDARKTADNAAETKSALIVRTSEALSNITGVNIDEEMALMMELEQSYAASAKLMQMIDEMLKTLLSVVR